MTSQLGFRPRWGFFAAFWFWLHVAGETFTSRRLSRVLERRLRGRRIDASGSELLPTSGPLVFAANHYHAGLTLDVIGAALGAAAAVRPGVADACTLVVGHRAADPNRRHRAWRGLMRWAARRFFDRWSRNTLRIPTGEVGVGIARLRAWRRRAACGPMLVFPEGVAKGELTNMREGAGRWLAALGVPIIPVGVWWADDHWNVRFGAPITWSTRADLRDLQLGLAIAALLPPMLAPEWTGALTRWRAAHASVTAWVRRPQDPAGFRGGSRWHARCNLGGSAPPTRAFTPKDANLLHHPFAERTAPSCANHPAIAGDLIDHPT